MKQKSNKELDEKLKAIEAKKGEKIKLDKNNKILRRR